ncbi:MAG: sortase [Clostridia bacterium]|nr:sortase [Clostridia bacterium]
MKENTKSYISFVTLLVVLVIFVQTNILTIMIFNLKGSTKVEEVITKKEIIAKEEEKEWKLTIPKIDVVGKIEEGTKEEIINNSIGHFSNTPYIDGNIGLIAGCFGYKENYFTNLQNLQQGDVILYQYGNQKKEYKVINNLIIDQKDWSYLSSTKENKLTLITGVINEPEKRRCVQAQEII